MQKRLFEVICHSCNRTWTIQRDSVVHAQIEKQLKRSILQRQYFTCQCRHCGSCIPFYFPFVYIDTKQKVLITLQIDPQKLGRLSHYEHYMQTSVENEQSLIQEILISDYDLDIQKINQVKQSLQHRYLNMYVDSIENDYVWFSSDEQSFGIAIQSIKK